MPLNARRCYEILESKEDASLDELKSSYRQLIKIWHPDRFPNDRALQQMCEEKAKLLTEAYRTIESDQRTGNRGKAAPQAPKPPIHQYRGPLKPIRVGTRWGYSDANGFLRIPAIYESAGEFSEGLAAVRQKETYGFIDEQGYVVIALRFSYVEAFHEGRALAEFVGFGYLDQRGEWIVKPNLEGGSRFQEGFAAVKQQGKWGYVNAHGGWLVPPRFDEAQPFRNGRAIATEAGRTLVVSANGDVQSR